MLESKGIGSNTAPRRMAFISTMVVSSWAGSEELWVGTALRLMAKGLDIYANVYKWPEWPEPLVRLREAGCLITRRHRIAKGLRGVVQRILNKILRLCTCNRKNEMVLWLRKIKPDFVVVSEGYSFTGAAWLESCQRLSIPYASITQAVSDLEWVSDHQAEYLRQIYQKAEACFFVSRHNLQATQLQLVARLLNASVVWNPFTVKFNAMPKWPSAEPFLKLACVARLHFFSKGQDILLQVLAESKWKNRPIHVTFFGAGPHEKRAKKIQAFLGISNVSWGGHVKDIEAIWPEYHALIMPSRVEGLPLSLVEAMLCGRIGIVTDVGGNAEVVLDNVTGFVAKAANATCLDEAMERAWQRREDWRDMGQKAAMEIRTLIPEDPVGAFTDRVLEVVRAIP